ncbi:MAG: AgmX/PglI C-terminal domain-containing protein [Bdellovibrionota bacterium]
MMILLLALAAHAADVPGGLDKSVIDKTVRESIAKFGECYDSAENAKPGKVATHFTIGADGKVTGAKIVSSELKNETIEICVTDRIKELVFPAPVGGGTVEVEYPFAFTPKKAKKKKH